MFPVPQCPMTRVPAEAAGCPFVGKEAALAAEGDAKETEEQGPYPGYKRPHAARHE